MCSSPSRGLSSNKLLAKVAVAISTLAIVSIGQGDAAANAGMFEQSDHEALIEVRRGATSRATPHEKLHLAQFYFDAEAEAVPAERGQAPVSCASLNGLSLATGTAIASETNSVLEFTGASTDEAAFRHPSSSAVRPNARETFCRGGSVCSLFRRRAAWQKSSPMTRGICIGLPPILDGDLLRGQAYANQA